MKKKGSVNKNNEKKLKEYWDRNGIDIDIQKVVKFVRAVRHKPQAD